MNMISRLFFINSTGISRGYLYEGISQHGEMFLETAGVSCTEDSVQWQRGKGARGFWAPFSYV